MPSVMHWLLELDPLRPAGEGRWSWDWQPPVGGWLIVLVLAAVLLIVHRLYRREDTTPRRRIVLGLLRAAVCGLVVLLLAGPVLILQRNQVERSRVALVLDTSRSMDATDVYSDTHAAQALSTAAQTPVERLGEASRLDWARTILSAQKSAVLRTLLERHAVDLYAASGSARAIASAEDAGQLAELETALQALAADGPVTDLSAATRDVLRAYTALPVGRPAAILLLSDGRATAPGGSSDTADAASVAFVPVLAVPFGSADPRRDLALGPATADPNIFVNDVLAIRATLEARGIREPLTATVRLIDESGTAAVATETVRISPGDPPREIELRTRPRQAGAQSFRVAVGPLDGERRLDNNAETLTVNVLREPLRVLYVDGYPRFEYRYLSTALIREPTVRVSCLLLSADRDFAQEGDDPIRRFPETAEELNAYDVVLFGDVDPADNWLGTARAQLLVDFVGERGGGFGLIAGERFAPARFRGTPLEKLVPVRIDPGTAAGTPASLSESFPPRFTPHGRQSRLFRFDADRAANDRLLENLPGPYWFARTRGPRPGAEVLIEHPASQAEADPAPLLVIGRYGAGKVLFQGIDETWRWRRRTGEWLHDAYWVQLVRELMPSRDLAQDRRLTLTADPPVSAAARPLELRVRVTDARLLESLGAQLDLMVRDTEDRPTARLMAQRLGADSPLYECTWTPSRPGRFTVQVEGVPPPAGQKPASAPVRIEDDSIETRRLEADPDALARLAERTGGRLVPPDRLAEAISTIEQRDLRTPDDVRVPLWRTKLAWIVLAALLTVEWILRKAWGVI